MRIIFFCLLPFLLSGCLLEDDNDKAVYGKDSGLPVNCRAYVQVAINGYRSGTYNASDTMNGIERNCGANGQIWKNNRNK